MDYKNVQPLADFDWSAIDKKEGVNNAETQKISEQYEKSFNAFTEQEVIEGVVVSISDREVVVNVGAKSDGIIPANEVRYNPELKVGDKIEVFVESQEDSNGQLLLSHKTARILKSWERVNQAYESQEIITGYVKSRTKGGLIVSVFDNIEAFLPGSQIDVKPIRDYDVYVDKTMEFKVVKINHEYKNVVVSHKALIEDELEAQKAEIISRLEKGQVLEGTVKNITPYGVFIDLGGVDGLVHITDLSWGRVSDPKDIVELDQKINVVILDFDEEKHRIALGLKQLTPQPWDTLDANLKEGDKIKGKVVVITDYGAFVEVVPGVEGLIHVSEMSWGQHPNKTAHDYVKVGDEVEAVVLNLDREARKMSLGLKQLQEDPWNSVAEKYPVGSKHSATVRNFSNFGIFVELEDGIEGLIHISDLSWTKKIKHPAEFTKQGEKIDVVVLECDIENRRLSLGHKQLEENPWDVYETLFAVGSVMEGTIANVNDKGATVTLSNDAEAFCPMRYLTKADGGKAHQGESLEVKVIEFNKDSHKIVVSHVATYKETVEAEHVKAENDETRKARSAQKTIKQINDSVERTTLADLLSDAMKEELKKGE